MLSRVLGLARELIFARFFGAGLATDAFNVAFRIPNLLRDLFAEGALSSAFVPAFTEKLAKEGREAAFELGNRVASCLALVVGAVCVLGLLVAEPLTRVMAPGFASIPGKLFLTVQMTRVMMFFLLLIALSAVAMGVLNSLGRFFLPALAPSFLSVGMIGGAYFLTPLMPRLGFDPVVAMAFGVMLGGLGQLLVQLPPLRREGWIMRFRPRFGDTGVRRIARLMLPGTVGMAATQFSVFINTWIASQLVQGSVSWLNYAFRLMQLPIGIFGVSVGLATQPEVSRMLAEGKRDRIADTVAHALTLVLLLNLPASGGLVVLAEPIVRLLYQGGRFDATDTVATALALQAYCIGLFAYSAVKVVNPVFYALDDAVTPMRNSMINVALTVTFNLAVMRLLGHLGLALGTSVAALASFTLLLVALRKRLGPMPSTLPSTLRIGLATLAMGFVCRAVLDQVTARLGVASFSARLAGVAVPGGAGVLALVAVLAALGSPELAMLSAAVKARGTRRAA
ncbi:MAG: murein biosynthesis integral membrane protein MurJ [Candidatus Wallbacteria bacterium]|nr:murein biosynthesis integral membrane protein MurJ [Candidatus Wallbacteria bacterium]